MARALVKEIRSRDLPVAGVSYGGNDQTSATAPLDWGSLIPLWFMGGRSDPQVPVVVMSPARDRSAEDHLTLGKVIAQTAAASGRRVALIASADHGHGHSVAGPYGFTTASAEYDELVCAMLKTGELSGLLKLDTSLVKTALADSYWQLLVLHGALEATELTWRAELLSYEVPTYFGMACASFQLTTKQKD